MQRLYKALTSAEAKSHTSPAVGPILEKVATKAQGCHIYTEDGTKYLDFSAGIGVLSTGHCHKNISKAISDQSSQLIHSQQSIFSAHKPLTELYARFEKIMPSHLDSYFLANSGSEAVDNAMKLARNYTKRANIIAFKGGYHGRTYGAMSVTSSKTSYKTGFEPQAPGVVIADYPYQAYQRLHGAQSWEDQDKYDEYRQNFEYMLKTIVSPSDVAGLIIEPIQGEGGFIVPPMWFLKYLQMKVKEFGWVFIIDEVQSGCGRTGKWWAHNYYPGIEPDIMIFAKGIGSGFPLAGLASRADLHKNLVKGSMGGTYGGNALGCAASCATIDTIENEGILANTLERGQYLMKELSLLQEEYSQIIDVRGKGLMIAVEFNVTGSAAKLVQEALKRNLIMLSAGARDTIRFLPPLVLKQEEAEEGLRIFKECLKAVFK